MGSEYFTPDEELKAFETLKKGRKAEGMIKNYRLYGIGSEDDQERYEKEAAEGRDAENRITGAYENLLRSVVLNLVTGDQIEDMMQEARIEFNKAITSFDASKGLRFSTFLTHRVSSKIKNAIGDQAPAGRKIYYESVAYEKAEKELAEELGRSPNTAEVATRMGIPEKTAQDIRDYITNVKSGFFSLDYLSDEGNETFGAYANINEQDSSFEDRLISQAFGQDIRKTVKELVTDDEYRMLELRYDLSGTGHEPTRREVGEIMGLTGQQVADMERRIKNKLQKSQKVQGLYNSL